MSSFTDAQYKYLSKLAKDFFEVHQRKSPNVEVHHSIPEVCNAVEAVARDKGYDWQAAKYGTLDLVMDVYHRYFEDSDEKVFLRRKRGI